MYWTSINLIQALKGFLKQVLEGEQERERVTTNPIFEVFFSFQSEVYFTILPIKVNHRIETNSRTLQELVKEEEEAKENLL